MFTPVRPKPKKQIRNSCSVAELFPSFRVPSGESSVPSINSASRTRLFSAIDIIRLKHFLGYCLPLLTSGVVLPIKATPIPFMTRAHRLLHLKEYDIQITIHQELLNDLKMPAFLSLKRQSSSAAAVRMYLPAFQRLLDRL